MKKQLAAAFSALLALASPALADDANVVYAKMPAHPALWTVHGPKGTAYLFGSIHVLPPQVDWHTKEIDAAMAKADVLVFELAMDDNFQERIRTYIRERGMLPEGQHLRDMLSPAARNEFDTEVADLSIPATAIDRMRPWLAALTIEVSGMKKQNYAPGSGVEMQMEGPNATDKRPVIGLETIEQQLALLAPDDPQTELQSFEASLTTSAEQPSEQMGPMLDAWMHGNVKRLDKLTTGVLSRFPRARKLLLDDRNDAWVRKISDLLDADKVYFITVGAAHLVGEHGVPNLLRAKGFHVDGP